MKDQKHDFLGALKQLAVIVTIIIWIGWLYMFFTGNGSSMYYSSKYGSGMHYLNANGMLFFAIFFTVMTVGLYVIKKRS